MAQITPLLQSPLWYKSALPTHPIIDNPIRMLLPESDATVIDRHTTFFTEQYNLFRSLAEVDSLEGATVWRFVEKLDLLMRIHGEDPGCYATMGRIIYFTDREGLTKTGTLIGMGSVSSISESLAGALTRALNRKAPSSQAMRTSQKTPNLGIVGDLISNDFAEHPARHTLALKLHRLMTHHHRAWRKWIKSGQAEESFTRILLNYRPGTPLSAEDQQLVNAIHETIYPHYN